MAAIQPSYTSHTVEVLGSKMHYIEQGSGDPILFIHGMPTSSYLWRNIIPYLAPLGRCIAIDLIGMGKSDKPDIDYSVNDHIKYLEKFIETLNLKNITLIMHDWGSVIGTDYAMRHESKCKGLVYYEAYLQPCNGDNFSLPLHEQINNLHEAFDHSELMKGTNFVDKFLPQAMMRPLTEEEMKHYREPFLQAGAGRPIQKYIQELPCGDGKSNVDALIDNYSKKLTKSRLPKLLMLSIPGFITTISTAEWAKKNIPNLEIVDIGEELHYAQETNPSLMGETISVWLQGVEQTV